ncbi:MAG: efflux transporter outer membrane subunit [Metallibacterium scheffleri]|jgi:multidrug efflux system outer membrane protein|uniref:efflux transporter outer membrane subunit n=1 Tax=Metallibacterium scheffleri TaxID=993689 RepID=UPI0026E9C273|nr:efflux transporter outer membrane subunit [Metallibacterium scheffleri]MCK9367350.1 efflux transporter outer membrane subunit [Metallibacterium scheffleri]
MNRIRTVSLIALLSLLTGCAGLPPALPPPPALRGDAPLRGLPSTTQAAWPTADWWRDFDDAQLDALMQQALRSSPDLAAARARVRAAVALAGLDAAAQRPHIGASADLTRQRLSENGLIPPRFLGFTWYTQSDLGAQLEYSFDFWGKQHAQLASRIDDVRAARAEAQAVRLGLTTAIASAYFAWQTDQAQLRDADALVKLQQQLHELSAARVRQGLDPEDLSADARLRWAQANAQREELAGITQMQRAVLAALVGVAPAQLPPLQPRPLPAVSAALPHDARLQLLARRPDLVALRWQVEAMGEQVRAARASFLPNLSLGAMAGFSSIDTSKALALGSRVFDVGPALSLPLFDGGALKARYGYSVAQLDAAAARYNQAVLDAAREVGVAVLDLQRLDAQRASQQRALMASAELSSQAAARLRQGLTDAAPTIASEASLIALHATLTALHGQQLAAEIALIQALGGGYADSDRTMEPSTATTTSPTVPAHVPDAMP